MPQFFSTECLFLGISGLLISKHLKKPPWIFFLFFLTNTLTCISSNNNTFSKTTLYCVFASNMTAGARGDITTLFSFPSNNPLPSSGDNKHCKYLKALHLPSFKNSYEHLHDVRDVPLTCPWGK